MAQFLHDTADQQHRWKQLQGFTEFANLGHVIQTLLLRMTADVTADDLQRLQHVTVRQLAKVYDALNADENPDEIWCFLRSHIRLNPPPPPPLPITAPKYTVKQAITTFEEAEKKSLEFIEYIQRAQAQRAQQREAQAAERRRRQQELFALATSLVASSETSPMACSLPEKDAAFVAHAFNKVADALQSEGGSHSTFDFDGVEWWKHEEYRRDFERMGRQGTAWTRVIEGGSQQATDAQLAERAEYYRNQCWWKADKYKRDWLASRDAEWWKDDVYMRDWRQEGHRWSAANEAVAEEGDANQLHKQRASEEEVARRTAWYTVNGPKGIVKLWCAYEEGSHDYCTRMEKATRQDFYKNGEWWKATARFATTEDQLHLASFAGPAGADREWWKSDAYRQDFQRGGTLWSSAAERSEPTLDEVAPCPPLERERRLQWYSRYWWKSDKYAADFAAKGTAWQAAADPDDGTPSNVGKRGVFRRCHPHELAEREAWYRSADDREWWKSNACLADYLVYGRHGARWTAVCANARDTSRASNESLAHREAWYQQNIWRGDASVQDWQMNGDLGVVWRRRSPSSAVEALEWWQRDDIVASYVASLNANDADAEWCRDATSVEVERRRQWYEAHFAVEAEADERRSWLQRQLDPCEIAARRAWLEAHSDPNRRLPLHGVKRVVTLLNDGEAPAQEHLEAVLQICRYRGTDNLVPCDSVNLHELLLALASTGTYVQPSADMIDRCSAESWETQRMEELSRDVEEAAARVFDAQEAQIPAASPDEGDVCLSGDVVEEVLQEPIVNEDDLSDTDQPLVVQEEDIDNYHEATPVERASEFDIEDDAFGDGDDDETQTLNGQQQEHPVVPNDYEECIECDDDAAEPPQPEDACTHDDGITAMEDRLWLEPWKLPLPRVSNPQYLKAYFTVVKHPGSSSSSWFRGKKRRVLVVDHFTRSFYMLDANGAVKKEHPANQLLQLELQVEDVKRARLLFFNSAHSHELEFASSHERQRFYETASAVRPSIRVFAPELAHPDPHVEACATTIDGFGPNAVSVACLSAEGRPTLRELTGVCRINASKILTEPLTVWCGTLNLSGQAPTSHDLSPWLPVNKYDVCAVAVQEASFRRSESDFYELVERHLGPDYVTLASMSLWDTLLIILCRKKHLLKITCVEGSTKATIHKSVCGTKGGVGISFKYLDTSFAFVSCHLAARLERNAMRNLNLDEIIRGLQLGRRDSEISGQFHHVFFFGDLNYRIDADVETATQLIHEGDYAKLLGHDQLMSQQRDEGILFDFVEPPITFPPTYRMAVGTAEYLVTGKDHAPSYCGRVLSRSMDPAGIKCTSYNSARTVQISEHVPVSASYVVRCLRPALSCFTPSSSPLPLLIFEDLCLCDNDRVAFKRPQLTVVASFMARPSPWLDADGPSETSSPTWFKSPCLLESNTRVQQYLEACHVLFLVREASEKRHDAAHRGTGHLLLRGRVLGRENVQQEFDVDVVYRGQRLGNILGRLRWEAATLESVVTTA